MSKYKDLWIYLKKVVGARKLAPPIPEVSRRSKYEDYIEELYDRCGKENFKLLTEKS